MADMRVLSVCSGIGADAVAWHPLGWQTVAFAEIDPHASAVLMQWHSYISGHDTTFTPAASDLQRHLEEVLGASLD